MVGIEIDLSKIERGTHEGYVTVHRKGKTFKRKQKLGRKEKDSKNEKLDPDIIKIKDDLMSYVKSGKVNDIFDKPEIGYNFIERIMAVKDKVFGEIPEKDFYTGEYTDQAEAMEGGRMVMNIPKEKAYDYISNPQNKHKFATLFNEYVKAVNKKG